MTLAAGRCREAIFHVAMRTASCPMLKAVVVIQGRQHQQPTRLPIIRAQAST